MTAATRKRGAAAIIPLAPRTPATGQGSQATCPQGGCTPIPGATRPP
jgi:hypothetical protein